MTRVFVLLLVVSLRAAACAARRPYTPPAVAPATLRQRRPGAGRRAAVRPALVGAVRRSGARRARDARRSRPITTCASRVARVDQARAIFDEVRARSVSDRDGRRQRRSPRSGRFPASPTSRAASTPIRAGFDAFWELDLFGRVRSQIRAAAATAQSFEATRDDVRVSVVAEIARNYFELRGLQQQLAVAERSLANQRETLRLAEVRRDAGIGEEQDVASAAARVAAIEASIPPIRGDARGAGASARGADRRRGPAALGVDLVAARLSAADQGAGGGRAEHAAAPPARCARRRAAAGRGDRARGRRRGRSLSADHDDRFLGLLAGRGNLFDVSRLARLGGDAGAELGGVRHRQRARASARRGGGDARVGGGLRADRAARARGDRERAGRLSREAAAAGAADRTGARERARRRHRARPLPRGRGRLSRAARCRAHPAAGRGRASRRPKPTVFTSVIAVYKALGGIPANPPPNPAAATVKQ